MNVAIVVGSVRQDSTTPPVAEACGAALRKRGWRTALLPLDSFTGMFDGDYVTPDSANDEQRKRLTIMERADAVLFVVPTYFKSMPGSLKNFYDVVRWKEVYDGKLIGFVASNHKNQDYGAGHARQVVDGILTFFDISAVVMHEIIIIHPNAIDKAEVGRFADIYTHYYQHYLR